MSITVTRTLCAALTVTSLAGSALAQQSPHYGEEIALRGTHGPYLVGEANGAANANVANLEPSALFVLHDDAAGQPDQPLHYGDVIGLRSAHGRWLVGEAGGALHANRDQQLGWERFTVIDPAGVGGPVTCGSSIGLLSFSEQYVVAESDGRANANRAELGPWEIWQVQCPTAPPPSPPIELDTLEIAGAPGLSLWVSRAEVVADGDGLAISGEFALDSESTSTDLEGDDVRATLDADGRVETLAGRATVIAEPGAALEELGLWDPIDGDIELVYGRDAGLLGAALDPDARALQVRPDAALDADLGPNGEVLGVDGILLDPMGEIAQFGGLAVVGGEVRVGGWQLVDGVVSVEPPAMPIGAALALETTRVPLLGRVDADGLALDGAVAFESVVLADKPSETVQFVERDHVADAEKCGYRRATTVNECPGAEQTCTSEWRINGEICGVTLTNPMECQAFGNCHYEPNGCNIETCVVECYVPADCTRIEREAEPIILPGVDFGRLTGDLTVHVSDGVVTATVDAQFCDTDQTCAPVDPAGVVIAPNTIDVCLDLPAAGEACVRL